MPEPYSRGVALEMHGHDRAALAAYSEGVARCTEDLAACRDLRLRRAETLARLGETRAAVACYLALRAFTRDPPTAARAQEGAAALLEGTGGHRAALDLSLNLIRTFPAETAADDALRRLVRWHVAAGRRGRLGHLLLTLFRELRDTPIGDNMLFEAARLYQDQRRPHEAIALCDQLTREYPRSALRDQCLWRAGQLLESLEDWAGALRRYRLLLAGRRDALLVGSYNSRHLDDAQLRVGLLLLEKLQDPHAALTSLEELRDEFPYSLLRDDAQFWIAQVHARAGDRAAACNDLRRLLRDFPDGNHAPRARAAMTQLPCPEPDR